jgi:hypothetical protein
VLQDLEAVGISERLGDLFDLLGIQRHTRF